MEKLRSSSVFTFRLVEGVVGRAYAKVLIHNLRRRGEIVELLRGVYTFKKSPYMMTKALPKSYVGLGAAAFLQGAWSQVPVMTILSPLVPTAVRGGERKICRSAVILRRISPKMYFGYHLVWVDELGEWVRVSSREKTLLDVIYMNYPFASELIPNLLEGVDEEKLTRYLGVMRERRVRGFKKVSSELERLGLGVRA